MQLKDLLVKDLCMICNKNFLLFSIKRKDRMKYFIRFMTLEEDFKTVISYTKPQGIVWLCTAAAFVVALITALISIQEMQKQSLVDQIRSVD